MLITTEIQLDPKDSKAITEHYAKGFLMGRRSPGYMYQTRAVRLNLADFAPNSENRRVLKKVDISVSSRTLPISAEEYDWQLAKFAKDFYTTKFNDAEFSAAKLKQLFTENYGFNFLLQYDYSEQDRAADSLHLGYGICYQNEVLLHYAYPFYDLKEVNTNLGMAMMLQAILWAQMEGKNYIYLGSATRPADKYKLQFAGLEWWDDGAWSRDIAKLKGLLEAPQN